MERTYFGMHNHTDYSNIRGLDSINKVSTLIDYAIEIGLEGVAITDHECLSGHVKALQYIEKIKKKVKNSPNYDEAYKTRVENFHVALGNEIYLVRNGLNKDNYIAGEDKYFHFILIAKDEIGHEQLRELSSRAWLRTYRQFIERVPTYYSDFEEIVGDNKGHLIATTACLGGYLPNLFSKYNLENNIQTKQTILQKMINFVKWNKEMFGEDFYIELQPSHQKEQREYNVFAYRFAKEHNVNLVIATDAHYLKESDRSIHKAYLNAAESEREVDSFYASTFVMTIEEIVDFMEKDFSLDQIREMLDNTLKAKEVCKNYSLFHKPIVPKSNIPFFVLKVPETALKFEYVKKFYSSSETAEQYLLHLIAEGIERKIPIEKQSRMWERINEELKELHDLSNTVEDCMSAYLLITREIVDIIWNDGDSLVGPSRGSALGFAIDYLIDITQINPVDREIPLPHWRFINGQRASMPDIDIDTQGLKRERIIKSLKNKYGEYNVALVATFRTEKTKSAILTGARGLGIDTDVAQYISSMVPVERGFLWSLKECYYGDVEKGRKPVTNFVNEMNENPELWEVVQRIEGLICGRSSHASGVLITNEKMTVHNAIMLTPKGVPISQYELNDSEFMGGLKFDLLSIDALDRIRVSMDLLIEYGYIEKQQSLKETYDKYFHPDVINYDNVEMWGKAHRGEVLSLFQFETPVGGDAIRRTKPVSLVELSIINSLMRLMAPEGMEMAIDSYIKYSDNIQLWYDDLKRAGLSREEIAILEEHLLPLKGIADSQESMMLLVMDSKISGYTLGEADGLRKIVGKKLMSEIPQAEAMFYEKGRARGSSENLLNYVWQVLIQRQLGYSFSSLHTYAYSTIAVIELNIYHFYPSIFWNTANLIVDSAGNEDIDEEDEEENLSITPEVIEIKEEEDNEEDETPQKIVEKKKTRSVDYGKISTAIGKIQQRGVTISPPHINNSKYTFTPDLEKDRIMFGIKGIARIGDDLVKTILTNRPYVSVDDFMSKIKVNKPQMVNLIKSGAFDELENSSRIEIMEKYIEQIADKKKRLTLQNMQMLIRYNLIPTELQFNAKLFNFNKYLKSFKSKDGIYYILNEHSYRFYEEHYNADVLEYISSQPHINQKLWDKTYSKDMDIMRDYLKQNPELLDELNNTLYLEMWNKYCNGTISKWEMDSISFYHHDHELAGIDENKYGIVNFYELPEDPIPVTTKSWNERSFPIYNLCRVAGTVLKKDKTKHLVTLLTQYGVVQVKVYQNQFSKYDKQISVKLDTGKKKVVEKSWFGRGNKVLVTGIRRGNNFVPKIYKNHRYAEPFCLITEINDDSIYYLTERTEVE